MIAWPRVWNGGPAEPRGEPALVVTFDAPTRNETNGREHFRAKAQRVIAIRDAVREALTFDDDRVARLAAAGPWCVRLTRLSSSAKPLDEDATGPALKAVQDAVAAALGIDDGSPLVAFCRAQERRKGALGVRVEVWGGEAIP